MGRRRVTIVGGGLSGLLLGRLRALAGDSVRVLEKRSEPASRSRPLGMVLSARSIRLLQQAGIHCEAVCEPLVGRQMYANTGSKTWMAPFGRACQMYGVEREALWSVLFTAALEAGCVVEFDANVSELDFHDDICIGSDGRHSTMRDLLKVPYQCRAIDSVWRSVLIHDTSCLARNVIHNFPLAGGFLHLMASPGSREIVGTLVLEKTIEIDEHLFEPVGAHLSQGIVDLIRKSALNSPVGKLTTVHCERYHSSENALLIGDAAHATVPFAGQGLNVALQDAAIVSRLLDHGRPLSDFSNRVHEMEAMHRLGLLRYKYLTCPPSAWRSTFQGRFGRYQSIYDMLYVNHEQEPPNYAQVVREVERQNVWYRIGRLI